MQKISKPELERHFMCAKAVCYWEIFAEMLDGNQDFAKKNSLKTQKNILNSIVEEGSEQHWQYAAGCLKGMGLG